MRIFKFILAVWFMLLAFSSLSNTWPVLWIVVYGSLAVLCVLSVFEFYRVSSLLIAGVILLVAMYFQSEGFIQWLYNGYDWIQIVSPSARENSVVNTARNFLELTSGILVIIFLGILKAIRPQPS